jgi:dGTPase
MISDIVRISAGQPNVRMSDDMETLTEKLRQFMFTHVYLGSAAKEEESKAENMIRMLYACFMDKPEMMGDDAAQRAGEDGLKQVVTDYIAGMTDRFAVKLFRDIYIPKGWYKY